MVKRQRDRGGSRARPGGTISRFTAMIDWLADPQGRAFKWLALAGLLAGIIAAVVAVADFGRSSAEPNATPTSLDVSADIPIVEAEVGHLTPDSAALALEDHLDTGSVMELHLSADSSRVYSSSCDEHLLGACYVTWAVECDPGYNPPYLMPGEEWPEGEDHYVLHCPTVWSIRTVDERGRETQSWEYAHGTLSLNGFFVVEGTGFGQGILTISLREIPPEVAKQLLR